ncbi:MAG TPA: chloride channel protein [Candidatus Acidoferrum sp.]|nr:chloride channel protein [Candidatus Acidoferrum sp.]
MTEIPAQTQTSWWKYPARHWNALLNQREAQVFLVLTLLIGALVGLMAVAFILLTERVGSRLYPVGGPAWHRVLIPIGGSLLMGYLLYRFFPDARGSGVPQTKAALYAREGRITAATAFGKFFCTSATLASGIPLGREGPTVQVGAGIASVLGRHLGLRPEKVKALLPVAAAAAIAAAFNTPLAAVLFALEEVVGDLHAPVLGSVVLASATSWAVLRLSLGNNPLFQVPQYQLVNPWEFAIYAVLGVAGGLVSVAFTKLLLRMRARFLSFPRKTAWFHPVAGGLLVGMMGWFVPQVLGVGYEHVGAVLNGGMALKLMILLLVLKLFAVTTCYASGNAGGIFGPSLFLGSMLGGIVGTVAHNFFPAYAATPGAYALVGMGAVFAGIVRAPMTSVVMIFEITRDYAVIVPLMISNLVSLFIASRLQKQPIYEALARQDGIHLPTAETREQEGHLQVILAMRPAKEILLADMTLNEALEKVRASDSTAWPVLAPEGLLGVLSFGKLQQAAAAGPETNRIRDLMDGNDFPHLHVDHPLSLALERMGTCQANSLPVVNRANVHKLEGIVTLKDVLALYGVGPQEKA